VDIVHLHWVHRWFGIESDDRTSRKIFESIRFVLQILWLRLRGIKIVWTVHNLFGHESINTTQEIIFNAILARLCHAIIIHCPDNKEQVIQTYKLSSTRKIFSVPQGHYIDTYKNEIERSDARKILSLSPEEFVFLFLGQVRPYKGVVELIEAFETLDCSYARLIIAGTCPSDIFKQQLIDLSKKNQRISTILEFVPDDQIKVYMNAADVVVLPFTQTLNSSSAILAMGFGKPVISPRLGCLPSLLEETGNLLYSPNDECGLSASMESAIGKNMRQVGEANYQRIRPQNWQEVAKKTKEIYLRCLKNLALYR